MELSYIYSIGLYMMLVLYQSLRIYLLFIPAIIDKFFQVYMS